MTENQNPTTKNVIKYISGVNSGNGFITVRRKKDVEKAKPYPDSTAVRVQDLILDVSDADSILSVSDLIVRLLNVRKQS